MLFLLKALPAVKGVLMLGVAGVAMSLVGVGCHQLRAGAVAQNEAKRLDAAMKVQTESAARVAQANAALQAKLHERGLVLQQQTTTIDRAPTAGADSVCMIDCLVPWPAGETP